VLIPHESPSPEASPTPLLIVAGEQGHTPALDSLSIRA
jgi:hypothetical protein